MNSSASPSDAGRRPCRERRPGPFRSARGFPSRRDRLPRALTCVAGSGVLSRIGREVQPPTPPLTLVADVGGGGLILAFGLLAALLDCQRSGAGQVVDAAMVDGAALLAAPFYAWAQTGQW